MGPTRAFQPFPEFLVKFSNHLVAREEGYGIRRKHPPSSGERGGTLLRCADVSSFSRRLLFGSQTYERIDWLQLIFVGRSVGRCQTI